MRTSMKMGTVLGESGPTNTVAPAITTTSTIGTQITGDDGTWTGAPAFTYQWQRNTGSFVNIGGATSKNYTPVDADFGYALQLVVTPNIGNAANSNATNLTQEATAQSFGAELLANGDFSAWTADNPDSWTVVGEVASDPMVTQVLPGGGAGAGAAKFFSSATASSPLIRQAILTAASYYESSIDISAYTAGLAAFGDNGGGFGSSGSSVATVKALGRSVNTLAQINAVGAAPQNFVINTASFKKLTANLQLTAPSANMRVSQFYTLPASPISGDAIWVMPRVSDFANGNYWLVFLTYTGTQWNINLYSVASHTRTSRTNATNIGTTNGIRINCNGDLFDLQTTANSGGVWTTRGSQVNNSLYNTATGANALATSTFTLGNMQYEPAV